ncbi:ABC transporter substrate-binding protein [Anaerolineales bacterium]
MKSFFSLLLLLFLIMPVYGQETNLMQECVTDYDASVDYFPDKIDLTYADNFFIEYHNNYKVVTVTDAFDSASDYVYVLVQCGTPIPDSADLPEFAAVVEVPINNFITLSTTQLPQLASLGLLDHLVGVDSFDYINSPAVIEKIDAGEIAAVGFGGDVNVEAVLNLEPDLVMTYGFNPETDAHPILPDAGIATAMNAEWREITPLGRAEWLKYLALFFNAEQQATSEFDAMVSRYEEARALVADIAVEDQPTVLFNTFSDWTGSWVIPGAETYIGVLILDAGGQIALGEEAPQKSADIPFEVVYEQALDSDIWVTNAFGLITISDLIASDERYADFAAVEAGNVWNNDQSVNENFGNNFYELGVTNPDLILTDLIAIFHPELLPDHEFNFYRQMTDD